MATKLPKGIAFRGEGPGCPPGSLRADESQLNLRAGGFQGWMRMGGTGDLPERFDLSDYMPAPKPSLAQVVRTDWATVWFASDERREE